MTSCVVVETQAVLFIKLFKWYWSVVATSMVVDNGNFAPLAGSPSLYLFFQLSWGLYQFGFAWGNFWWKASQWNISVSLKPLLAPAINTRPPVITLFLSIFQWLIFLGSIPILYWACEATLHSSKAIKRVFTLRVFWWRFMQLFKGSFCPQGYSSQHKFFKWLF